MRDRALELTQRLNFELEVALEDLLDILANVEPAERLEIGQAVEKQDASREPVGVLHLVDRLGPLERVELLDAPIVEQAIVQPILIGRGELVLQRFVEKLDDLGVALHTALRRVLGGGCAGPARRSSGQATARSFGRWPRSSSMISCA